MTTFKEMPLLPESDATHGGRFAYTTASELKRAFTSAASRLRDQAGSRAKYVSAAKQDFTGHYSEIFAANAATAAQDAANLATAMETVAGYVQQMIDAGHKEDARRRQNNEWVREHNKREEERSHHNWLQRRGDDVHDFFAGEEERPNMDPGPAPSFPAADVNAGTRQEYGKGAAGGTSSARPEDLRSFATGCGSLDDDLSSTPGTLESHLSDFATQCAWGSISASGVVSAYRSYLSSNKNDATWAKTIADAFAAAGGEGNVSQVSDASLGEALKAAGVSEKRSALHIDPPTAAGAMPSTGYADDPVNTATGNFLEPETDLGFDGVASGLSLTRMYNSLPSGLSKPGVFGPGWASVLDQFLDVGDEGARWVKEDGRLVVFPREGTGFGRGVRENFWLRQERAGEGILAELRCVPEGIDKLFVVRDNHGAWWAFSASGAWLGAGSGPGRTVSVRREATSGVVVHMENGSSRSVDVEHVDGRVAVVTADDGRRVEYVYDEAGHLIRVDSAGASRHYTLNEAGLIHTVVSAAGVAEVTNTYDADGRVTSQVSAHGRVSRYAYLPGRVTVVSDGDGSRSNSWLHDAQGRLVGILDADDAKQSMAYDTHGNLLMFTERDGSVTVHAYDERGRRTRTVTPEGADLTFGYDDADRLTALVTATGAVVEYEYATAQDLDPSVIRDALGGTTQLRWDKGLLQEVTDPTGVRIRFGYDEHGDLVSSTNASGDTARIVRDGAGRPVQAVSPSGATTAFGYDATGNLISRTDPDGSGWRFEHDVAGRLTALTDPSGARTELEYGPGGDLVSTTDPLGRRIERVIDDLGNVAAAVLPDGSAWEFEHDALSRLRVITDPAGGQWLREYSRIGDLTAVVDPTGVRVDAASDRRGGTATVRDAFATRTVRFDEYGRPTQVSSQDETAELVSYDAAGNPVELVDGEGGLTRLVRDVAGRVVEVVSPSGATTRYEYDACGRPWRSTDPLGAVTELVYDADSRVVRQISPVGETSFEYDACSRLTRVTSPSGEVSRYGHDALGRVTFVADPWYGVRHFSYNAAGELVSTRNGLGGVTRFEYDERSRLVRITDPSGGVTTRTYTELDKVASETEAAGRVTTARYDAAGRQLSQTDPDGHTTTWTYDAAGCEESTSVDGTVLSRVSRDAVGRKVVVTDSTRADGALVEHTLSFDRRGLLTSHQRIGAGQERSLNWAWDKDGNRAAFTDAHGVTTKYERDAAGRITAVTNPKLGRAVFERDAAGRLARSVAGDLIQEWVYRSSRLVEHARTSATEPQAVDATHLGYDSEGRVAVIARNGSETTYTYDQAGQLLGLTTRRGGEEETTGYEYSEGGLLLAESTSAGTTTYEYDEAGQLIRVTHPDGAEARYVYDGLGRRVRRIEADGSAREYAWGPTGYLSACVDRNADGAEIAAQHLWVDALGQLAQVDDTALAWDTAAPFPSLVAVADTQVVHLPGSLTGVGEVFTTAGWRDARPSGADDPWAAIGAPALPTPGWHAGGRADTPGGIPGLLPAGVGLTAGGGLEVAGLEWMGARVYDAGTRSFLSTDPLPPTLGAGWDGNPYAYAGNTPLAFTDPNGLKPLTDKELKAYDDSARSGLAKAGSWVGENWEYFAGGAMVIAGGVLMATGVGGPAGMMLISAGADTIIQKATTGGVNWGEVALSGALGGFGGASIAAKAGLTGIKGAMVAGASSGGIGGGLQSAYSYYTGPGPHTLAGGLQATATGTAFGAVTGIAGGAAGHKVSQTIMNSVTRNPGANTVVMGRLMETRVHPYGAEHGYGTYNALPPKLYKFTEDHLPESMHNSVHLWANKKWINYQMMQGKGIVDIGEPAPSLNPRGKGGLPASPYYDMERRQVAGYSGYSSDFQPSWDLG